VLPPAVNFTHAVTGRRASFQYIGSPNHTLFWDFGNQTTSRMMHPLVEYAQDGVYEVTLVAVNHCGDTTKLMKRIIIGTNGLDDKETLMDFVIHPNPTAGYLRVELLNSDLPYNVQITNSLGQVVETRQAIRKKTEFYLEEWANGVYFLTAETEYGQLTKRFVLQK
jgi:PKD repeat protein